MAEDLTRSDADAQGPIQPRRRVDGIIERVLDGELVVYDTRQQQVHILNPTAAFVWAMCDGEHLPQHIVSELIGRFPEHEISIHEDVPPILRTFAEAGLLAAWRLEHQSCM